MATRCSHCGNELSTDDRAALQAAGRETLEAIEAMLMDELDFDGCDDSGACEHVVEREVA